jgi:flagellin
MGLRISTNVSSINAQRSLNQNQRAADNSLSQLSSGSRINKAADDAAGLAISENLKAQVRSTRMASRNAQDGVSLVQTAEGGLNEIANIIVRLRELGIQAASDTIGDTERGFVNKEVQQLKDEMQRISQVTTWGKTKLLDGSTPSFDFQVGTFNNESEDRISFEAGQNMATIDALGLTGVDYSSKQGAQAALNSLDSAQEKVSGMRANLGALQNRLTSTITNLGVTEENLAAANSRIRDTDIAHTTAEMTKSQILLQASTATLAQANAKDQLALKLRG